MLLLSPLGQQFNLHALLEQAKRLCEVANAELILSVGCFSRVTYSEVEPLLVAFRVRVNLDVKVVALDDLCLVRAALLLVLLAQLLGLNSLQVTTLENRIENQMLKLGAHADSFLSLPPT